MWLTSLIHKGRMLDSTVVPSQDILRMATKWGARALMDDHLYAVQNNHHAALEHIEQFDAGMKMAQACAMLRRPGHALAHHIPM